MTPMEINALYHGLKALADTGLLVSLVEGWGTSEEHASRAGTQPAATALLLQVFEGSGLLERRGDQVRASDALSYHEKGVSSRQERVWTHVGPWLRTGAPLVRPNHDAIGKSYATDVVEMLARMFAPAAHRLTQALASLGVVNPTVLDAGCGSGVFGLSVIEACGGTLVAQDLPPVLARTKERAEALGLAQRVQYLPGDFMEVELPTVDVAILANVLHLAPAEPARRLLERVVSAVAPGGHVVVVDALSNGDADRARAKDVYAVHLALRLDGAHPHADDTLRDWLRPHCTSVVAMTLDEAMLGAIVGVRR